MRSSACRAGERGVSADWCAPSRNHTVRRSYDRGVPEAATRTAFSSGEADEIRRRLGALPSARLAEQRTTLARFRQLGLSLGESPTTNASEVQVSAGHLHFSNDGAARAAITPLPRSNVFRVAVGVKGHPVPPDWSAFDQRYQWFGGPPRHVAKGTHLFALAVDRWRSAVVGLYEAMSAGAERLPGSPDPARWPWALGVKPLAPIPVPGALRIDGLYGPQNGLPASIPSDELLSIPYASVANSPPPPGPRTREQEVQLLQKEDVLDDVLAAVRSLGRDARRPAVIARAIEIGAWNEEDLDVRAWYTGSGTGTHIQRIVTSALDAGVGLGTLVQTHRVYAQTRLGADSGFGVPYQRASDRKPAEIEPPPHMADLAELDRATRRHMELQDRLATDAAQ
jgi:hypothetical protein